MGRNPFWLFAAGALGGLAVLVRVEGLVFLAALGVTLVVPQFRAAARQSWLRFTGAVSSLVLGCGLVLGPYLIAVGALTPTVAVSRILGRYEPGAQEEESPAPARGATGGLPARVVRRLQSVADKQPVAPHSATFARLRLAGGEPMSFATKEPTTSLRRRGYAAAIAQFAEELADAFGYLIGAFALIALWRLRRMLVRPAVRFAQVYFLLVSVAAVHFAAREGYLAARHLLPLVVVGIGFAGYGLLDAGQWITRRGRVGHPAGSESSPGRAAHSRRSPWAWTAVALAGSVCLITLARPLHENQLGHRLAADWLAQDALAPGLVLDTRGWTGLYSGRTTYGYDEAATAFAHPQLAYVVLERRELAYESGRARTLRRLLEVAAEPVATFPRPAVSRHGQRTVLVYRWDRERLSRWSVAEAKRRRTEGTAHR